jgi:putative transposase
MPSRNVVKSYIENSFYHVYNRGVEKRSIFEDTQDYKVFLKYLKEYLSEPPKPEDLKTIFTLQGETFKGLKRQPKNYSGKVILIAYCLMSNHFHLLIQQKSKTDMQEFLRSICTRYSIYFNKKYERVGGLFQGPYKAALITEDAYLLHLSRYIHLNPLEHADGMVGAYSSYADYLELRKTDWVKPDHILNYFNQKLASEFKKFNSYKDFVEKYKNDATEILGKLTLED